MSLVSVIIPNFNNAAWLPKCVESCLKQGQAFVKEIIIVDDFSTDNSLQVLDTLQKKHGTIIQFYCNTQKGANYARNLGFSKSSGEFIQWLDSDDFIAQSKFEVQTNFLRKNTSINIVFSDWRYDYYQDGKFAYSEKNTGAKYEDYLKELLSENWQPCHNYLIKRNIAEELHKKQAWNPATKVGQDKEYFLEACFLGAKFGYIAGEFAIYNRVNTNSISQINFKKRLEIQMKMDSILRNKINSGNFSKKEKKTYIAILNTHTINAFYYNKKLSINELYFFTSLKFKYIHWKKYPFVPFIYIYQQVKYFFR